jgi:hypothetical protein
MMFSTLPKALLACAALSLAACETRPESVCEDVGDCTQGGDSDWIESCQDEAKLLEHEADADGCRTYFDDYYACADSSFQCQGATPSFSGCEPKRSALDTCLTTARTKTACGELDARTSACAGTDVDGGAPDAGPVPPACTLARDCEARCYLDQVSDVCSPHVDDLARFRKCAASCPP